jgi:hypothetical protein
MATDGKKLLEITIRVMCDVRAENTIDAVYLYGQTQDNQSSVLSAACQMLKEKRIRKILIADSGPKSGYPGFTLWEKALREMGVPKTALSGVDLRQTTTLNTLIEANAMIQYAKRNQYESIYIVASPFHQLRAFMTSVTAAQNFYPEIKIYSHNGHPLPWRDHVVHSQGETSGRRRELIGGEFERIKKYQQKGDLAQDADVLNYLNQRDV